MDASGFRVLRFFVGIWVTVMAASIIVEASGLPHEPYLGMSELGSAVGLLEPDGPAARAGLSVGDRILSVNGRPVVGLWGLSFPLRAGVPREPIVLSVERGGSVFAATLIPENLPPAEVAWNLAQAVAALIALFVGSLVVMRRVGALTIVFFLVCQSLSLLLFFPYVPPAAAFQAAANLGKLLLAALFPALFLHFFLLFPYRRAVLRRRPGLTRLPYLFSLVVFLLGLSTVLPLWPPRALDVAVKGSQVLPAAGFAASFVGSVVLFVRAYRRTALASIRHKLRVSLWSTIAGVTPIAAVLIFHEILPGHEIPLDRLSAIALVLIPVGFGYAILKHGVFDIELIVKRSLVVTGVTAVLILLYFLSYFLLRALLHSVTNLSGTLVSVMAFAFVIVLFSPIRGHIQDLVDRSVYPERFASRRRLREFARNLPTLSDEGEIIRASLLNVARTLGVMRGGYFPVTDPAGCAAFSWGLAAGDPTLTLGPLLRDPVLRRGEPMMREEVDAELPYGLLPPDQDAILSKLEARVFVPFSVGPHHFGIAVFGRRADEDPYSMSDLEILDSLSTQTALAMENAQFQKEVRVKEAITRELSVAQTLQRQLLPHTSPEIPGIEITAVTLPCHEVGGDYFDYIVTGDQNLCLAVGDVSGKGITAAILMANVQALFRAEARDDIEPDQVLDRMNRRLCEIERPDRFVSFFCARVDPARGELRYSNAGHPPPLLVRSDGEVHHLDAAALLLGILPDVRYPLGVVRLAPGDLVLCYTDGIPDSLAGLSSSLREDELEKMVCSLRHLSAENLLDRLLERLRDGPTLEDDTTLLILKAV